MNQTRPRSIKNFLLRTILTFSLALFAVVAIYTVRSVIIVNREINRYNGESIRTYTEQFDRELSAIASENNQLLVNNIAVKSLSQAKCSESTRVFGEFYLRELLTNMTAPYEICVFYNDVSENLLYYYGEDVKDESKFLIHSAFLHRFSEEYLQNQEYTLNQWFLYLEEGTPFLCIVNRSNHGYLYSFVDLNEYCLSHEARTYDDYGIFRVTYGGEELFTTVRESRAPLSHNLSQKNSLYSGLTFEIQSKAGVYWKYIVPSIMICLALLLIIIVISWFFMRVLRESLLFPMQEMANRSAELSGKEAAKNSGKRMFVEYEQIRDALDDLLLQKQHLEEQYHTTQEQKEHALLQYYQMQTRSHFFINCLKSLYSMADKGNSLQMKAMIISFSNHLRYIFHDNLIQVSLRDELKEVDDYHKIISMDLTVPLLINQKIPVELRDLQVPPLIIQTFLENTYKYAKRKQGILLFQIEAEKVWLDQKAYVKFHIFDNGGGYAEDVLDNINQPVSEAFTDYHVGINNLRHRIQIIYGEECRDHYYNEQGGAHSVIYLPIKEEKEEDQSDTRDR